LYLYLMKSSSLFAPTKTKQYSLIDDESKAISFVLSITLKMLFNSSYTNANFLLIYSLLWLRLAYFSTNSERNYGFCYWLLDASEIYEYIETRMVICRK
jgi:hypothetical protein